MCAEALPWRCHRSFIADALAAARRRSDGRLSATAARTQALPDFARVEGTRVIYDGGSVGMCP